MSKAFAGLAEKYKENSMAYQIADNRTPISSLSQDELQGLFNWSESRSQILANLGHDPKSGGSYSTLKRYENFHQIDLTEFNKRFKKVKDAHMSRISKSSKTLNDLVLGGDIQNREIKKLILENSLLPYECGWCGNSGIHNNQELVLQLDHIDGNNKNHVIENLRFLCPNCHSQTKTYGSKNRK